MWTLLVFLKQPPYNRKFFWDIALSDSWFAEEMFLFGMRKVEIFLEIIFDFSGCFIDFLIKSNYKKEGE